MQNKKVPIRYLYYVLLAIPFLTLGIILHVLDFQSRIISFLIQLSLNENILFVIENPLSVMTYGLGMTVLLGSIFLFIVYRIETLYTKKKYSTLYILFFLAPIIIYFSLHNYIALTSTQIIHKSSFFADLQTVNIDSIERSIFNANIVREVSYARTASSRCALTFTIENIIKTQNSFYSIVASTTELDNYLAYTLFNIFKQKNVPLEIFANKFQTEALDSCNQEEIDDYLKEIQNNLGVYPL